jgi:hypothetical protein
LIKTKPNRKWSPLSNVVELIKAEFFLYARPKWEGSSPWTCPG